MWSVRQGHQAVGHHPPGDARPRHHSISICMEVVDRQFGQGCGHAVLPEGHFSLINKAPALDRMDEVVVDGNVVGTLRFDLGRGWTFLTRMPAARAMQGTMARGMVVADDGALGPILSGSNLLVPGVASCSEGIRVGGCGGAGPERKAFANGIGPDEQRGNGSRGKRDWRSGPMAPDPLGSTCPHAEVGLGGGAGGQSTRDGA